MKVLRTIPAGHDGTQKYVNIWGNKLLNIRYREDELTGKILTTVELVVDERSRLRPKSQQQSYLASRDRTIVGVRISYDEVDLRLAVRKKGGKWDGNSKLWFMPMGLAIAFGLKDRIIPSGKR